MSNICKTVTLRTRKIKGGEQLSFYLDLLVSAKNLWLFHGSLFSRTADIMDV